MNNLSIISQNGKLLADSREVAEMTGKQHSHLMRDIQGYTEILGESNFGLADFFIESKYKDAQEKERPCYLLTRKGCDMVANKMTGAKGVLFTAEYVTRFEEMEQALKPQKPTCIEDVLIQSLQEQKAIREQLAAVTEKAVLMDTKVDEVKNDLQSMRDICTLSPNSWRSDTTNLVNKMALKAGGGV